LDLNTADNAIMRTSITFLLGLIAGALVFAGIQQFVQNHRRFSGGVPPANVPPELMLQMNLLQARLASRKSIKIDYSKPMYVSAGAKRWKVQFTPTEEGPRERSNLRETPPVEYRWESDQESEEVNENGKGSLVENYKVVGRYMGGDELKDIGGQLSVRISGIELEWSYVDSGYGFIYYYPDEATVSQ